MEEHFPERNIRLAASSDAIDTDEGENETAPIKSLPNERAAPLKCAAAGAERSLQRGVAGALFHWQNQKGRCTRKKYDMEEINEESRGRFYMEVGIRLNGEGFSTKPLEDGRLPARWRGARLCRPSCKPGGRMRNTSSSQTSMARCWQGIPPRWVAFTRDELLLRCTHLWEPARRRGRAGEAIPQATAEVEENLPDETEKMKSGAQVGNPMCLIRSPYQLCPPVPFVALWVAGVCRSYFLRLTPAPPQARRAGRGSRRSAPRGFSRSSART